MRFRLLVLSGLFVLLAGRESAALVDLIIDDSQAELSEWNGVLQTGTGNNSYNGGYHYITGWGGYDGCDGGCPNAESARIFYRLPSGFQLPPGDNLYNVYAWMPSTAWDEWHVLNIAADGTENDDQDIDWGGAFQTSKQWVEIPPSRPFDVQLGGRWMKLGPGPQADSSANGVHINPVNGSPYFYIEYQPYYDGTILFDAIIESCFGNER